MEILECCGYLKKEELVITWTINLSCNYSCVYCDTRTPSPNPKRELLDKIIDYINHVNKIRSVILKIGGGEPTICRDYSYVMKRLECKTIIPITNLSKDIDFWKELYSPNISLHASYHHLMTNQNEYFNKCKGLIELGYKNTVSLVMFYPSHQEEIMEFYLKLKTLEKENVFCVLPRAIRYDKIPIDDKLMIWINNNYPKELYIKCKDDNNIIERFVSSEEIKNTGYNNFKFYRCECGKYNLSIDPHGKVFYCEAYRQNNIDAIFDLDSCSDFTEFDYLLDKSIACRVDRCLCEMFVPKKKILLGRLI